MIKVFTSGESSSRAGDDLTDQFEKWKTQMETGETKLEIKSFDSSSNKYGWMLTVLYSTYKMS
jgi:hypothetical protein